MKFLRFLFPQRIGRWSYFVRSVIYVALLYPYERIFDKYEYSDHWLTVSLLFVMIIGMPLFGFLSIIRPRCKEIGAHSAVGLLVIIPLVWLILLIAKTSPLHYLKEESFSDES